jgi:natural product biosynthesis luciferase-like monooxygenase domain
VFFTAAMSVVRINFFCNLMPHMSILRMIEHHATTKPDASAFMYLDGGETESESLTFGELHQQARFVAHSLRLIVDPLDRVALAIPDGLQFILAFFGCLFAGVTPVPLHSSSSNRFRERFAGILNDCEARAIVTTRALMPRIANAITDVPLILRPMILCIEELGTECKEYLQLADRDHHVAFLQYTSGSTSTPKGVIVTHNNLVSNQQMIQRAFGTSADSVIVGWLPLHHDMGLIGNVMQTVWTGARCILMSPAAFLQRPACWLEAIANYKATISGGPDFAYRLCAERVTDSQLEGLDLASWLVAFNGAEPIRRATMLAFSNRFRSFGFSIDSFTPCYGLAEATLFVAGKTAGTSPRLVSLGGLDTHPLTEPNDSERWFVSCGKIAPELKLLVVDPKTKVPCKECSEGEIWLSGPTIGNGYWKRSSKRDNAFHSTLATHKGIFLRTGDLGFRLDDQLVVTGRLKDIIIVRGRNYHPEDIEFTARASSEQLATSVNACFPVTIDGKEAAVLVQEVPHGHFSPSALQPLLSSIRSHVADIDGLHLSEVAFVTRGIIPRTTSGKVRRGTCRDAYLAGKLRPLTVGAPETGQEGYDNATRNETLRYQLHKATQILSDVARLPDDHIDTNSSLISIGLDSLMMAEFRRRLEEELRLQTRLEDMYSGKNLRAIIENSQSLSFYQRSIDEVSCENGGLKETPLSIGQTALWFLHLIAPEDSAYNLAAALRVVQDPPLEVLTEAFRDVISQYASLNSVVVNVDGTPFFRQIVNAPPQIIVVDTSGWDQATYSKTLQELANEPFPLYEVRPARAYWLPNKTCGGVLLFVFHHIAVDLLSLEIIFRQLNHAYSTRLACLEYRHQEGRDAGDFATRQAHFLSSGSWDSHKQYWKDYLGSHDAALSSPFRSVVPRGIRTSQSVRFVVPLEVMNNLHRIGRETGVSLFSVLLSSFQLLLLRLTGQDELFVGSVASGRTHDEWRTGVGYFINQVVFRAHIGPSESFRELLLRVHDDVLNALKHQDYPFSLVADEFYARCGSREAPITRIMFAFHGIHKGASNAFAGLALGCPGAKGKLGNLDLEAIPVENRGSQFDLSLSMVETDHGIFGTFQFIREAIEPVILERFSERFENILQSISEDITCTIATVPLLTEAEIMKVMKEWNGPVVPLDTAFLVHDLIDKRAKTDPHAIAVRARDGILTYRQLSEQSHQVARWLITSGLSPGQVVAYSSSRTTGLPVVLLGILKAGGVFLPLDPALPAARTKFMLDQTSAQYMIVHGSPVWASRSVRDQCTLIDLDRLLAFEIDGPETLSNNTIRPEASAYVIFTSGSTGRPKGVMVSHRNLLNFMAGMSLLFECHPCDRFLSLTSISFDISLLELLWPLTRGATVELVPEAGHRASSLLAITSPKRKLDFSLFYFADASDQHGPDRYRLLLEGARYADENDFAAIWTPERHFHPFGGAYPNPTITSAAIASITKTIKIRAGSVVLPLHDPIRVAEEWSVIDNLSGGRVGVAFASGWHVDDFVLAPGSFPARRDIMLTSIDMVRSLWRGDAIERTNGNGKKIIVRIFPPPVQQNLPMWITASGTPATFTLAGTLGANLLTHLLGQSLEEVEINIQLYRQALRDHGFDPSEYQVTLMVHTFIGRNREDVRNRIKTPFKNYLRSSIGLIEKLVSSLQAPVDIRSLPAKDLDDLLEFAFSRYWETSGLFGTPETVQAFLKQIERIGVTEVASLIDFGVATEEVLESLPMLREAARRFTFERNFESFDHRSSSQRPKTFLQCTPSMMKLLLAEGDFTFMKSVDTLLLGGESLPATLIESLQEKLACQIFNMYGPTETTIWSTAEKIGRHQDVITVGRPVANTQCFILDSRQLPVIPGCVGELFIAGEGVSQGYWGRADLTSERFTPCPFSSREDAIMYRTGDLAKHLSDGRIVLLGRSDYQIKIRGHRVELAEIDSTIAGLHGVVDSVTLYSDVDGQGVLTSFYVDHGGDVCSDWIREKISRILPKYMVPQHILPIPAIPLMANGKVDRDALTELLFNEPIAQPTQTTIGTNLKSNLQTAIADIWKTVLSISDVGLDDNFFDLGGHSLLMVQVHTALSQLLNRQVPLVTLLEKPTIRSLSEALRADSIQESPASEVFSEKLRAERQRAGIAAIRKSNVIARTTAH